MGFRRLPPASLVFLCLICVFGLIHLRGAAKVCDPSSYFCSNSLWGFSGVRPRSDSSDRGLTRAQLYFRKVSYSFSDQISDLRRFLSCTEPQCCQSSTDVGCVGGHTRIHVLLVSILISVIREQGRRLARTQGAQPRARTGTR